MRPPVLDQFFDTLHTIEVIANVLLASGLYLVAIGAAVLWSKLRAAK
jgi:hypothetical protein